MENDYGAWISPKGNYYPVPNFTAHEEIAKQITGTLFWSPEDSGLLPETRFLIASGFCRVLFEKGFAKLEYNIKLTRYQKEYLEVFEEKYRVEEQPENCLWKEFQDHANEKYNFVPLKPFKETV